MQPAAKPSAPGSTAEPRKASTNTKAGTATSGCGAAATSVHQSASLGRTPREASAVAVARPSGTLWRAMASVVSTPLDHPRSPANETPTPEPSPRACAAMTATNRKFLRLSLCEEEEEEEGKESGSSEERERGSELGARPPPMPLARLPLLLLPLLLPPLPTLNSPV